MSLFEEQLQGNFSLWPPQPQAAGAEGCPWRGQPAACPPPRKEPRYEFLPVCLAAASPQTLLVYSLTQKEKREKKNELSHFAFSVKFLTNSTPQG